MEAGREFQFFEVMGTNVYLFIDENQMGLINGEVNVLL